MNPDELLDAGAARIAHAVRRREVSATEMVRASLARIATTDSQVNAFTDITAERALDRAAALDSKLAAQFASTSASSSASTLIRLPLSGVPFAAKNLFDIERITTRAGSKIERDKPPAQRDALLIERMEDAGAILVGALNMDEYAYGFTTENSHDGPTRNPHDLSRISGGSSGGSAAAVAAGQVPLALGSDTNGSIRVPASLCGVFGLKPTYGRLPRIGTYPFVASLDHLGPFARTAHDLAIAYDAMQGGDARDPACAQRPVEPSLPAIERGIDGLRIATLGGYFDAHAGSQARSALERVAAALNVTRQIDLPEVERARAAAFLISNSEGGALHLPDLRKRAADFEPLSRDRFIAGALLPAAWINSAQRVRHWFARQVALSMADVDILLAPATPVAATPIGADWIEIEGRRLPARPSMGILTQPISCIGLPVCAAPVWLPQYALPIGVQIIAAPWREDLALRVAHALEAMGVVAAPIAALATGIGAAA